MHSPFLASDTGVGKNVGFLSRDDDDKRRRRFSFSSCFKRQRAVTVQKSLRTRESYGNEKSNPQTWKMRTREAIRVKLVKMNM